MLLFLLEKQHYGHLNWQMASFDSSNFSDYNLLLQARNQSRNTFLCVPVRFWKIHGIFQLHVCVCEILTTMCHNSHKNNQNPLTSWRLFVTKCERLQSLNFNTVSIKQWNVFEISNKLSTRIECAQSQVIVLLIIMFKNWNIGLRIIELL